MPSKKQSAEADLVVNTKKIIQEIEVLSTDQQTIRVNELFNELYSEAAQPKSASGNACIKLCGFVDNASKSESPAVQAWAFEANTTEKLFTFFMDWNEYDHHRSMKLVLDLIVQLLTKNPSQQDASMTKKSLVQNLMAIILGKSTKPVAKSAMKALEYFLAKKIVSLGDARESYESFSKPAAGAAKVQIWGSMMVEIFNWMKLHFVSPAAGKLILCIYRQLRQGLDGADATPTVDDWHAWLLEFLNREPEHLERVKNHIFLPLFTADKQEALVFLQRMAELKSVSGTAGVDTPALLQLAVLEIGKKAGLVEEPALGDTDADGKPNEEIDSSVTIHEDVLENALSYPSNPVRSLAFSILITSPSTTKPYSETALSLLRKHIGAFFADSDVKFRVDVSAAARDMFRRVRGAIFVLKRSIPRVRAKAAKKAQALAGQTDAAASGPVLYRTNLVSLPEQQLVHCLEYHEEFLCWYLDFLCSELIPTASYQRHITSLKALMYIFRLEANAGKAWETAEDQTLFFDVFDDKWSRALFDLLMDPFDDVRDAATNVLRALFSDSRYRKMLTCRDGTTKTISNALEELAKTASELARQTSRADHADGVARVNQLLYRFSPDKEHRLQHLRRLADEVDRKVTVAESDLGRAVREAPVHGDFAALCSTWQVVSEFKMEQDELAAAKAIQEQLVSLCQRIWGAVRDILCDDSPEGHLPLHLEEMEGLDTKGLISYSFRATHESSNLMKTIILTTRNRGRTDSVTPSAATFRAVGDLTFDQLSNLRHRGAFTTVSSTFTTCCQQSKHLETPASEKNILNLWYDKTMDTIYSQVSTTRRSAGIPSLITGILAANTDSPSFDEVMQKLLEIARIQAVVTEIDDTQLPQVHAYNSIKDIFRNSLLTSQGNKSEQYLPECVELAASGLKSEVWAIRNCSLILLRSLVDCLFGNHESKTTIEAGWDGKANRIPYHRYPTLPEVLRSLLESGHKMMSQTADASTAAESVFPALDIIRRAGPPDTLRVEIQGHIAQYLSSPVWHVREMAARTMCSCLLHEGWLSSVQGIFAAALKAPKKQNMLHGALLVLKFVVERLAEVNAELVLTNMSTLVEALPSYNIETEYRDCPDIVAAYLEAINLLWTLQRKHSLPQQPAAVAIIPGPESALFRSQHILHQLLAASREGDLVPNLSTALVSSRIGSNTLLTALEAMPDLYPASAQPISSLPALCGLYVDVSLIAGPAEVKAAAVENLNLVTSQLLSTGNAHLLPVDKLLEQWHALPSHAMNPELSNAIIRASGAVVATSPTVNLSSWAAMLADASAADNSFDTRLAAAESLRSYFTAVGSSCTTPAHLPVLLALYDVLNDDDDDVRDVGTDAAKRILGQAAVPIEASTRLLACMATTFAADKDLKQVTCDRVIGGTASTPASKMLAEALRFDDSLFVIEEQNLFIDEVREVSRWSDVLEKLQWTVDDACLATLNAWVAEGLGSLVVQMQKSDGPLGWASSPDAFAVSSYVVGAAVALTRAKQASSSVTVAAAKLKEACQQGNVSRLLVDALNQV